MDSSSIFTTVRVRPLSGNEIDKRTRIIVSHDSSLQKIGIVDPSTLSHAEDVSADWKGSQKHFYFDSIFGSSSSQDRVYDICGQPSVRHCLDGFNCCILAYGQTGSGKTYTMFGNNNNYATSTNNAGFGDVVNNDMGKPIGQELESEAGLVPRLCHELIHEAQLLLTRRQHHHVEGGDHVLKVDISASYYEIYNERVNDLLSEKTTSSRIREHPQTGAYVEGLTRLTISNYEQIELLLKRGEKKRAVGSTLQNSNSSRSHAIFTIYVTQEVSIADQLSGSNRTRSEEIGVSGASELQREQRLSTPNEDIEGDRSDIMIRQGKVSLVDLAGSERASLTGATGSRLREANNINKSLSTLGDVIVCLSERSLRKEMHSSSSGNAVGSNFVPYRNSVLTWLLRDSLGGNSKCTMLATVSPSESSYGETISTLRFLDRAKRVVLQAARNDLMIKQHQQLAEVESANASKIKLLEDEVRSLQCQLQARAADQERLMELLQQATEAPRHPISHDSSQGASPRDEAEMNFNLRSLGGQLDVEFSLPSEISNPSSPQTQLLHQIHEESMREIIRNLRMELALAKEEMSIKQLEFECIMESNECELSEKRRDIEELEARIEHGVAAQLDLARERNEMFDYFTELLVEAAGKENEPRATEDCNDSVEQSGIIESTAVSLGMDYKANPSTDSTHEIVGLVIDSLCLNVQLSSIQGKLDQEQDKNMMLQQDMDEINNELFAEHEDHEKEIKTLKDSLYSAQMTTSSGRNAALREIRALEIRRASQFLDLSNQVTEKDRIIADLVQNLELDRNRYEANLNTLRQEFNRAINSFAKASTVTVPNILDKSLDTTSSEHATQNDGDYNNAQDILEEMQAEIALLNILLFQRLSEPKNLSMLKPGELAPEDSVPHQDVAESVITSPTITKIRGNASPDTHYVDVSDEYLSRQAKSEDLISSTPNAYQQPANIICDSPSDFQSGGLATEDFSNIVETVPIPAPVSHWRSSSSIEKSLQLLEYFADRMESIVRKQESLQASFQAQCSTYLGAAIEQSNNFLNAARARRHLSDTDNSIDFSGGSCSDGINSDPGNDSSQPGSMSLDSPGFGVKKGPCCMESFSFIGSQFAELSKSLAAMIAAQKKALTSLGANIRESGPIQSSPSKDSKVFKMAFGLREESVDLAPQSSNRHQIFSAFSSTATTPRTSPRPTSALYGGSARTRKRTTFQDELTLSSMTSSTISGDSDTIPRTSSAIHSSTSSNSTPTDYNGSQNHRFDNFAPFAVPISLSSTMGSPMIALEDKLSGGQVSDRDLVRLSAFSDVTPNSIGKGSSTEHSSFNPGPSSISKALVMTKLSLAQHYADYEELQQGYRALERSICDYKLKIASLQEEIEDRNDEIIRLNQR